MTTVSDIKRAIKDIRIHYSANLNNKYLRIITTTIQLPTKLTREIDYLLTVEMLYIDSRGTIQDLYAGINALITYSEELKRASSSLRVYLDNCRSTYHDNEKIIAEMAIKNFPMNINILDAKVVELFKMLVEYDKTSFFENEVYKTSTDYQDIESYIEKSTSTK